MLVVSARGTAPSEAQGVNIMAKNVTYMNKANKTYIFLISVYVGFIGLAGVVAILVK